MNTTKLIPVVIRHSIVGTRGQTALKVYVKKLGSSGRLEQGIRLRHSGVGKDTLKHETAYVSVCTSLRKPLQILFKHIITAE